MRRCLIFFFLLFTAPVLRAQFDPRDELRAIVSGDADGVKERLLQALDRPGVQADPLLLARTMEMLGEQYYRLNDIDEARRYWDEAYVIRVSNFGPSSAEAGVGLGWRTRYHNYISASLWDHQVEAEKVAMKALELLEKDGNVIPMEKVVAQRERAYSFKVYHSDHSVHDPPDLGEITSSAASRPYFKDALRTAEMAGDTIWIAQLMHDLGNTFTDEAIPYRDDPERLRMVMDSAKWYYSRSIDLMEGIGLGLSEPVMMDHLTLGLLHTYAFELEGSTASLAQYQTALRVLFEMSGVPGEASLFEFFPVVHNQAQVIELYMFMAQIYETMYVAGMGQGYLDSAVVAAEAAVPYWEAMVTGYESRNIHSVTSSYAHFSFDHASRFHIKRYRSSSDPEDLYQALVSMERNRNVKKQRERLNAGMPPIELTERFRDHASIKAPAGRLVLVYAKTDDHLVVAIDEHGMELVDLGLLPFDHFGGHSIFPEFPVDRRTADMAEYISASNEWYVRLLDRVLREDDTRELVIVPYATLAHLPFEALVTDTTNGDPQDPHYLLRQRVVRYALTVNDALMPILEIASEEPAVAISTQHGLSDLPFARELVDRLTRLFPDVELEDSLDSGDLPVLLNDPGLLHIASHAVSPGMSDLEPYLLLDDGQWPLARLDDLDVERDLVVLATCSSGSGRVIIGEAPLSLGHSFLQAGAQAVVHTLWPVDDMATNEILGHMYKAMADGASAGLALHNAKLRFLKDHRNDGLADPFYWSGIVLTGRDVVLKQEPWHRGVWPWSVGAFVCAIAILAAYRSFSRRSTRTFN